MKFPLAWAAVAVLTSAAHAQKVADDDAPSSSEKRPHGYPEQIEVKEVRVLLKTLDLHLQGCGPRNIISVYRQDDASKIRTPWVGGKVTLTKIDIPVGPGSGGLWFLHSLRLGDQLYDRKSPDDDVLHWREDLSKWKNENDP